MNNFTPLKNVKIDSPFWKKYTDIAKDGMLSGTNLELYRELNEIRGIDFTASCGITSMEELHILKNMGVASAILGKALYAGRLELKNVIKEIGAE